MHKDLKARIKFTKPDSITLCMQVLYMSPLFRKPKHINPLVNKNYTYNNAITKCVSSEYAPEICDDRVCLWGEIRDEDNIIVSKKYITTEQRDFDFKNIVVGLYVWAELAFGRKAHISEIMRIVENLKYLNLDKDELIFNFYD